MLKRHRLSCASPGPEATPTRSPEDRYRGPLFVPQEQLAHRGRGSGQNASGSDRPHSRGRGAMDELLDAYEFAQPRGRRSKTGAFCITHANYFPSQRNLELCKELGVCARRQPVWLYKDGTTLHQSPRQGAHALVPSVQDLAGVHHHRAAGSDHMIKLDALEATKPVGPPLARHGRRTHAHDGGGTDHRPGRVPDPRAGRAAVHDQQRLSNREEKSKGSLEPGKLADLIVIDRDCTHLPREGRSRKTKVALHHRRRQGGVRAEGVRSGSRAPIWGMSRPIVRHRDWPAMQ